MRTLSIILMSLFLFSCSDDDDCPTNCGVITNDEISDEKERYRVIVEECLYFSDIVFKFYL